MKKFLYLLCAGIFLYLFSAICSISWIDGVSNSDFPERHQLSAARLFWSITPTIDKNSDADRALKLSWLKVKMEINIKEKKQISSIVALLVSESYFIKKIISSNSRSMSKEIKLKAAAQLLVYINRVELYQKYANIMLEEKLREFNSEMPDADIPTQESWHREMMIRSYLMGNIDEYKTSRSELVSLFEKHGQDLPIGFKEGVLSFYDGVLLCIAKKSADASIPLAMASKNFSNHPQLTTNFLQQDLNLLLLGRGMESGVGCNDYLTNVISAGV